MFNSNSGRNRDAGTPTIPPAPAHSPAKRGMFSVIGQDVTITGNVSATADLHIDGRVDGDVNCGNLVQGSESRITGNVRAQSARLAGAIDGKVSVNQLVVERAARITGDVEYETIAIENGAAIDGRLKHGAPQVQATLVATPTQPAPAVSAVPSPSPFGEQAA